MQWNVGLQDFKQCSLELGASNNHFTTELLDVDFERGRDIADIFYDHLAVRQTKFVEVLYSGGLDSELVLLSCLRKKIPVKAITMIIKIDNMIINTHDLYYAEKFCRNHNVEQILIELDAGEFYSSGKYYDYLAPYHITEPHVATHLWLIEQCSYFPVIGGDWPWVQVDKKAKLLSPFRLEFSSYERFMRDKGIPGIGNMIGHSLEASCKMIALHIDSHIGSEDVALLKQRMYQQIEPGITEPRRRSYGWENVTSATLNLLLIKISLLKKLKPTTHSIKWGNVISTLLDTTLHESSTFR
jgi:hypothetical protein